jgi:hypothetical protein
MFFGNVVLGFSLLFLFEDRGGSFGAADWVFWIALASLVVIRYVDIRFFDGCTATGARASVAHWIRYAVLLVTGSAAVWVLAHVVSRRLPSP